MNCDRCIPKVCDPDESKREEPPTRRLDRVSGSAPKPPELGFGWKRDTLDYGADGMATIYTQGDAIVTRSPGGLDVEAIDTPDVHRQLAYLFGFFEHGGR